MNVKSRNPLIAPKFGAEVWKAKILELLVVCNSNLSFGELRKKDSQRSKLQCQSLERSKLLGFGPPKLSHGWASNHQEQEALGTQELNYELGRAERIFLSPLQTSTRLEHQEPNALGHKWNSNFLEFHLWPKAWQKNLKYIQETNKKQTWKKVKRKQETWNMKQESMQETNHERK